MLYASAKEGWASATFTKEPPADSRNMSQLLDAIIRHVPPPTANLEAPFQMLVGIQLLKSLRLHFIFSPLALPFIHSAYLGCVDIAYMVLLVC